MRVGSTMTLFAVFLAAVTLLGFLILADNNSKAKAPESTGKQFDKIASNGGLLKDFSKSSGEDIIKKVEIQNIPSGSKEYWDGFETVKINIEEFENDAKDGNVSLRLLEKDFEIQINEISRLNGGKLYRYSGLVKGIPQSKATFYIYGELFSGSIEFEDLMYNIAVTSETDNGKPVYIVLLVDWSKDRERLKYFLNPLTCFAFGQEARTECYWVLVL